MAEYIEREALLEKIEEYEPLNWTGSDAEMQADSDYRFYRALVEEQPIADVVEAVRCKDCKYYHASWLPGLQKNDNYGQCEKLHFLSEEYSTRFDDDFCSYGERKDG